MPESRLDLKHVGILMRSHAKYAVRGGSGLTFALIVVVLGLVVAGILIDPLDHERKKLEEKYGQDIPRETFLESVIQGASPLIAYWLGVSEESGGEQMTYLLKDRPALLSVMFLILMTLQPFLMGFGGFNQLSGDIANRGLRYLLLRTGRLNIVLARLAGTFIFAASTSLLTVLMVIGYLALRYDFYKVGDLVTWGLYGWGALSVLSLPYLALCTWISTSVASPFGALAIAEMAIGLPIVAINYAQIISTKSKLDWLDRLTPWGWRFDLLNPDLAKVGIAVAVMLGFFLLFAFLGTRHFLRRDL